MDYRVVLTADAESDLEALVKYLLTEKESEQAARSVLEDFEITKQNLYIVADKLKLCENPRLRKYGYRRINFISHRYFMLYRIVEDMAIVDNIFHELQDYENKII